MLEIAGGVILGGLGILLILWLIGLMAENAEEIAAGCGFLLIAIAVFGVWYFLDTEFPEIDWIKTAFAALGILFLAAIIIEIIYEKYFKEKKENYHKIKKYVNKNKIIFTKEQIKNSVYIILCMLFVVSSMFFLSAILQN